jgi:SSS family solute:Na+ symporter
VTVAVTLVTKPKPVSELQGLVWGMANKEDAATAAVHDKWWESPYLLGFGAVALGAILTIIFF